MRKSDRRNCVFHAPPSVIPSPCPSFCPPPPCHSVEPSPLCHSEERQYLDEESIPAPKPLRATRSSIFLFLYFLVQESTKELLHGVNGGIRLHSFAERARKTYAVPNTRSGRSLPRRTKPRHFHECGTKVQVPPPTKTTVIPSSYPSFCGAVSLLSFCGALSPLSF